MLQGKEDIIERFLMGKANPQEEMFLKGLLENDPILANHVKDEKLLVEALKTYRANQLKARLEKIKIVDYSKYYKVGAALLGVCLLTLGVYIANNNKDQLNTKTSNQLSQQQKLDDAQIDSEQTTKFKLSDEESVSDKEVLTPSLSVDNNQNVGEKKISNNYQRTESLAKNDAVELEFQDHSSFAPKLNNGLNKDSDIELPESEISKTPKIIKNRLSVAVERGSGEFMYRFSSGKLYLYGEFVDKYEIIEWNKASSDAFFLLYDGDYYEINKNKHEVTKLEKVNDENKIKLLKSFEAE